VRGITHYGLSRRKACSGQVNFTGMLRIFESVPEWLRKLVLYDCGERFSIQRCSANQGAVDFFLRHERGNVIRLDRAAV